MNTKVPLLKGAIALAITTSTILATSTAFAKPHEHQGYYQENRDRTVYSQGTYYSDRYDHGRYDYDNRRYPYPNPYPYPYSYRQPVRLYPGATIVRLPDGCRKVIYRNQVYFTRNDDVYYAYDPGRRAYVVVNLGRLNIRF